MRKQWLAEICEHAVRSADAKIRSAGHEDRSTLITGMHWSQYCFIVARLTATSGRPPGHFSTPAAFSSGHPGLVMSGQRTGTIVTLAHCFCMVEVHAKNSLHTPRSFMER